MLSGFWFCLLEFLSLTGGQYTIHTYYVSVFSFNELLLYWYSILSETYSGTLASLIPELILVFNEDLTKLRVSIRVFPHRFFEFYR